MTTAFGTPEVEIPRGSYGRPLIKLPDDPETLVEYDRCSSYGKSIDDGGGLMYWAKCLVIKGASMNPDLTMSALPLEYDTDKKKLYELAEAAMTLAGAGNKASRGTAMHAWTDIIDRGLPLPKTVDADTVADLEAYRRVTAGLVHEASERFVVCDELRAAGSFDRLTRITGEFAGVAANPWLEGLVCIGDLKTGNAEAAIAGIAIQLAIYSRGHYYDPATGERTPTGADQHVGLVIHLPLGGRAAQVIAVDLDLGWEGALAAQRARAYQARAKLGCKLCTAGYYKTGGPCRVCKGTPRVPLGVTVATA